jgi:hypothetical protein
MRVENNQSKKSKHLGGIMCFWLKIQKKPNQTSPHTAIIITEAKLELLPRTATPNEESEMRVQRVGRVIVRLDILSCTWRKKSCHLWQREEEK